MLFKRQHNRHLCIPNRYSTTYFDRRPELVSFPALPEHRRPVLTTQFSRRRDVARRETVSPYVYFVYKRIYRSMHPIQVTHTHIINVDAPSDNAVALACTLQMNVTEYVGTHHRDYELSTLKKKCRYKR